MNTISKCTKCEKEKNTKDYEHDMIWGTAERRQNKQDLTLFVINDTSLRNIQVISSFQSCMNDGFEMNSSQPFVLETCQQDFLIINTSFVGQYTGELKRCAEIRASDHSSAAACRLPCDCLSAQPPKNLPVCHSIVYYDCCNFDLYNIKLKNDVIRIEPTI